MAYEKNDKKDEKKKMSAKERYEAYLEKERKLNEMLEGISDEDLSELDMSKMSARERYAVYQARDAQKQAKAEAEQEAKEHKNSSPKLEKQVEKSAKEQPDASEEETPQLTDEQEEKEETTDETKEKQIDRGARGGSTGAEDELVKRAFIRRIIFSIAFAIAALALQMISIHVPFTPHLFKIDFSALPELFAAITYGPLTGIIIVFVKNLLYVLINHNSLASCVSNVIVDSVFVTLAGFMYTKSIFMKPKSLRNMSSSKRNFRIMLTRSVNAFGSGIVSGIVSALLSFFTINYITFPIIFRKVLKEDYTKMLLEQYNSGLNGVKSHLPEFIANRIPEITNLLQGTLVYNVEITFIKYALVAVLTALIYPFVSDFLHYRK